jgi:nitrogenase-associated protein
MSTITFWEKPGCEGNGRQKAVLKAAGHTVVEKSLLDEPWTATRLLQFLAPLPVPLWFNRTASAVKDGSVVPETLSPEDAMLLLLQYPLLIRRPLMQAEDGSCMVGFVLEQVDAWIGLGEAMPAQPVDQCVMSSPCPPPNAP